MMTGQLLKVTGQGISPLNSLEQAYMSVPAALIGTIMYPNVDKRI